MVLNIQVWLTTLFGLLFRYDGIVCDANQVILQMLFRSNNLAGSIPAEVSGLESICSWVPHHAIHLPTHAMPREQMGIMTNLIRLDLGSNPNLRGTIPPQLGLCTLLQGLDLQENDLTGTFRCFYCQQSGEQYELT